MADEKKIESNRYNVLRPLHYGKRKLGPGDVVLLTAAEAQGLVETKAIQLEPKATTDVKAVDLTKETK